MTGAVPDVNVLTITGVNFGTGPFVTLDLVPLTLRGTGDSQIVAAVPVSVMPPGDTCSPSAVDRSGRRNRIVSVDPWRRQTRAGRIGPKASERSRCGTPSAAGADPAVQVGDRVITVAEVDREWQRTDPAGYIALSRQMYEMRRRIADTMAADELLAREAAARGLTIQALLDGRDSEAGHHDTGLGGACALRRARRSGPRRHARTDAPGAARVAAEDHEPELAKMAYVEELMKVSTRVENFLVAPRVAVERTAQDAVLGPATAPVELVAFGDFQNTEYARFAARSAGFATRLAIACALVFKNLPTLGPSSVAAAEAAQCALSQGKFWPYHDALLVPPGIVGATQFKRVAADLGLDATAFDACVDRGATRGVVQQAQDEARRYGLQRSPSFLINGRLAPDPPPFLPPFDYFKRLIEEELGLQAKAASRPKE